MFRTLAYTKLDSSIRAGIPKVEGTLQASALKQLSNRSARLENSANCIARINLADIPETDDRAVFVGPTAYNFLNVFLKPELEIRSSGPTPSKHPLHFIQCASKESALAIFAILSSHLAYWWWHAHSDGFHVTKRFIAEFPFCLESVATNSVSELSSCGAELWALISSNPIISVNRGRSSLAYSPNGFDQIRRKADRILADQSGLRTPFVDELQQFTAHKVAAKLRHHTISEPTKSDSI
jgi:hypothetical protein